MTTGDEEEKPMKPVRFRRLLRWGAVAFALVCAAWLVTWLAQRSLSTPAKKRAMQAWLDENLNADVLFSDDSDAMSVRVNVLRDSRLVLRQTEIEHPNPVFSGKFARIQRMGAWVPPLALLGVIPGELELQFRELVLNMEQGENGEWSHQGLMRPLASGHAPFPFPVPKISRWRAYVEDSRLVLRRRGYEFTLDVEGEVNGRPGRDTISAHADSAEYLFGRVDSDAKVRGTAGPVNLVMQLGDGRGDLPLPIPGRCEVGVKGLPVFALPFFVQGIPMDEGPGVFDGVIRYDSHPGAVGALFMEGELKDIPLAVFGLPRSAPFRLSWPIGPEQDGLEARVHMGPAGYGAFEMVIRLDASGQPRLLAMRGDVAALDDVPAFFTRHSRWPDWLSRVFPRLRWQTGRWRGFGWQGDNLVLELSRTMAGMTLNGEGEMLGGKVRLSMSPDQVDAPITVAAEKLDPVQLSSKLSQLMPDVFRAHILGGNVNLTWRGFPAGDGALDEWGAGMVWAKPTVDLRGSGAFWQSMTGVTRSIAGALPQWGGGDDSELRAMADQTSIPLDQLSIVSERGLDGSMVVEFRAYGGSFGQITGIIERRRDSSVEGEFFLAGASGVLDAVERANPSFARALDFLANDAPGLRVSFQLKPEGEMEFTPHFLDDAKRIHEELQKGLDGRVTP